MSTSVDVMAVIDRESSIACAYRKETGAHILAEEAADDARAAHSAFAELIELAEEAVDDYDCGAVWGHQIGKLRAVLARVKGVSV